MGDFPGYIEALLAPKGMAFWFVVLVAGLAATVFFFLNVSNRDALDDTMKVAGGTNSMIGLFDLCGPHRARIEQSRAFSPPERLWCYDNEYLDKFKAAASSRTTIFGDTGLAHYVRPTLIWKDIGFAIAMAAFTTSAAIGLAGLLPWQPWAGYMMLFAAFMGIFYGIADVAEDLKLVAIFENPEPVDPGDATTARTLTRLKIATLTVSGVGGLAFLLLNTVANHLKRLNA
jgi:hypothetical protein